MQNAAESQGGDSRVFFWPFLLSSSALANAIAETVRRIVAEARPHQGRPVIIGGRTYKLRVTVQKTKEERDKNRRLVKMAEVVYECLQEDDAERNKQPWQLVCWRTTTAIVHGKRTVVLNRDVDQLRRLLEGGLEQAHDGGDPQQRGGTRS